MAKNIVVAEKILRLILQVVNHSLEIKELGNMLDYKSDFDTAEMIDNTVTTLRTLRSKLKEARIAMDAFIESQEVYKEVMGFRYNTTLIETDIPQLMPLMDQEIAKCFQFKE